MPAVAIGQPTYVDGNWSSAEAVGLPIYSSPIRAVNESYVFTQDFMQQLSAFHPLPLGAGAETGGAGFYLVMEGPRQDIGGGMVKWTRTYARVPLPHNEYESYSYPFIGYLGLWISGNTSLPPSVQTGRPRTSRIVTSKVLYEYFLITDDSQVGTIPVIQAQKYLAGTSDTDYLSDAVTVGPISYLATTPSKTEYQGWVTASASGNFESGNPIVAEDSRISRWLGPIWCRTTRLIMPQ